MRKAGHDRYLSWNRKYRCKKISSSCVDAEGVVSKVQEGELKSLLTDLEHDLDNLSKHLAIWQREVELFRSRYYCLNYFTTPQLLLLRQYLGELNVGCDNDDRRGEMLALLGAVNTNCSIYAVKDAIREAQKFFGVLSRGLGDIANQLLSESDIEHITEMGFSRESAIAALNASNRDLNSAVTYCVDYLSDHNSAQLPERNFVLHSYSSLQLRQEGSDDREQTDKSVYLSLEMLGKVLEYLASSFPNWPERSFPADQFRSGEPNLIIIPQNDLLPGILSLYMRDFRFVLPSAQEVLVCTPTTSVEEICLFWRRALLDPNHRRLFCLARADSLNYEVSRKSWEEFHRLTQNLHSSVRYVAYKFVVICSAENEDKSYMVDVLDSYRRASVPLPSLAEIQSYLKNKFCRIPSSCQGLGGQLFPAASLDHQNSSVRVVRSSRAGDGKSFFINHIAHKLSNLPQNRFARTGFGNTSNQALHVVIPLHDKEVNTNDILEILLPMSPSSEAPLARLIHVDVSPSVVKGLDIFLFSLLILGEISDSEGHVWRRSLDDLYVVEITSTVAVFEQSQRGVASATMARRVRSSKRQANVRFCDWLPSVSCNSPQEAKCYLASGATPNVGDPDMDDGEFRNSNVQRAFQYLERYNRNENLDPFTFRASNIEGTHLTCLQTLLSNCGLDNPTWSQLKYFINFLSSQLRDCEKNDFCNPEAYGNDLPGFKQFVIKFMILMSRDFATQSFDDPPESIASQIELMVLRRCWEHSSHPYMFFNEDRHSVTFVEVQITRDGRLMDPRNGQVLDSIMSSDLSTALYTQGFRLQENYDNWSKVRKLGVLCAVMGVENVYDPDETYELTMDNVKKILAIQMRFRCGIPVILMGETGCGKTRLIRYMSSLQSNLTGARNMILMKVHGGVTRRDIIAKVHEAERVARKNRRDYQGSRIQTVLFFDEANTTGALGLIKELMCDKRVNGRKVEGLGSSLQVIAACNPYRKHTKEMIERLESAGLGYHVSADETEDKIGHIPLRRLVYRVHDLPESMKALVWDFGQLNPAIETLYIKQIVSRHVAIRQSIPNIHNLVEVVTEVLAAAQSYMRKQDDECSFVSLRDVERAMIVMVWFYELHDQLEHRMSAKHDQYQGQLAANRQLPQLEYLTRSFILALGVCYQARLRERRPFLEYISQRFRAPCNVPGGAEQIEREITNCQQIFLDELELPPQIAKNHALSENVFMMIVCIDLCIPLFLVGKPGSSKSLAKDVVKNSMKGQLSSSTLFQALKQCHMVSYQCSPLSTAEGIIGVFQQCQRAQKERGNDKFVSCVVLDEVGLAEDSPRLPLKALHPLLDDGTAGADDIGEEASRSNRVAFVGLSNWALDPAKMNRGILVNREVPDDNELIVSAQGICSSDCHIQTLLSSLFDGLASAYKEIYITQKREFFGLRDFYSLVKMLFSLCRSSKQCPTWNQLEHAVRRNFGGQSDDEIITVFRRCCSVAEDDRRSENEEQLDNSAVGLIQANLQKQSVTSLGESRYLLLLTKNYAALNIIRQRILNNDDPVIIFGSSFPKDQEYTHVCRTINRVKVCMATGRMVVLLNLNKLYESLYDALNQYYVYHGGQRFVDLGLGNHRVKCQVHKDFRLILVAEQTDVYDKFPIPLINRMEKHFLAMESVLSPEQQVIVDRVNEWAKQFASVDAQQHVWRSNDTGQTKFSVADAFVGFNDDAAATVVLQACRRKMICDRTSLFCNTRVETDDVFELAENSLLNCATPDAVARLHVSQLSGEASRLWELYFSQQRHSSLLDYLRAKLVENSLEESLLLQVTTHSRLLSVGLTEFRKALGIHIDSIALQQFDNEQQFVKRLKEFYSHGSPQDRVLLVQCEAGDMNSELVACARYLVQEERESSLAHALEQSPEREFTYFRHLVLVIQLPRVTGGSFRGFQGGVWDEVHIDELRPANQVLTPSITSLVNKKISSLLGTASEFQASNLDVDLRSDTSENLGCSESNETLTEEATPVLNAESVLRACIHGAVSLLDDMDESIDNTSKRIHILMQLLPGDSRLDVPTCEPFYKQLKHQVIRLLHEQESHQDSTSATEWVRNEALSHSSLQKGGTFRRALWLRVVDTVTPVLSKIIAFVDSNHNLKLLEEVAAGSRSWLTDLWLDIFNSSLISCHDYKFLSPLQKAVSQRVRVLSSGLNEHLFSAQFPFSHVIKLELDGMMRKAKDIAADRGEKIVTTVQRLFDSSELGAVVRIVGKDSSNSADELVRRYLYDFIHMVYNVSSIEEMKVFDSPSCCNQR